LGAIIIDPKSLNDIATQIKPEYFYIPQHRDIYTAMSSMFELNQVIDFVSLLEKLKRDGVYDEAGGKAYIAKRQKIEKVEQGSKRKVCSALSTHIFHKKPSSFASDNADECKQKVRKRACRRSDSHTDARIFIIARVHGHGLCPADTEKRHAHKSKQIKMLERVQCDAPEVPCRRVAKQI
jgi:hypothetical protein